MGTTVNCTFDVFVVDQSTRCNFGARWSPELQTCVACAEPGGCSAGEYYDADNQCQGHGMTDDSCQPCACPCVRRIAASAALLLLSCCYC